MSNARRHKRSTPKRTGKGPYRGMRKLLDDIRLVIEAHDDGETCDSDMQPIMIYWQIGKIIRRELRRCKDPREQRKLVDSLARRLVAEYGPCYRKKTSGV